MSSPSPYLVASDGMAYVPLDLHGLTAEEAQSIILCEKKANGENAEHQAMFCASLIMSRLIADDARERQDEFTQSLSTFWGYLKDLKLPGEVFKSTGILRYRRINYRDVQAWLEEIPKYSRITKSDEELGILEGDKNTELGAEFQNLQELLAACYCEPYPGFLIEYLQSMRKRHRYMLYKVIAEESDEKQKKKENAYRLRREEEVENLLQSKTTPPWYKKRLARELEPELDVKVRLIRSSRSFCRILRVSA